MMTNSDALLRAVLNMTARVAFPPNILEEIVLRGSGEKQRKAYNMCDGTTTQSDIAKANKLDQGNFSRSVARWIEAGVMYRLGEGREFDTATHLSPATQPSKAERKVKDDEGSMSRVEQKLDTIIRLLALTVAPDTLSLREKAMRLDRAGLTPKDIASICDTTPNTVSVALSIAKRDAKKRRKISK